MEREKGSHGAVIKPCAIGPFPWTNLAAMTGYREPVIAADNRTAGMIVFNAAWKMPVAYSPTSTVSSTGGMYVITRSEMKTTASG